MYRGPHVHDVYQLIKALLHDTIFSETCNAMLMTTKHCKLLLDRTLHAATGFASFRCIVSCRDGVLHAYFLTATCFAMALRCRLQGKLPRVIGAFTVTRYPRQRKSLHFLFRVELSVQPTTEPKPPFRPMTQ